MAKNRFTSFTQFEGNNLSNTSKVPDINEQKYGVTPNAPKVITKPTFVGPDQAKNLLAESKLRSNALLDANEYGKTFTFDNSPTSASFKARYKGYGQDTYNRIGFDPDINNEDIYNKNTSTFDDMKRWFKHSAAPMLGLGFMAPIHSYGKLLGSGDVGADRQEAKDYEYYNSIGYSSRGGIGGFATNLLNSVSYSAGILLEGAVEGAMVSGAVGAATGGELNLLGGALGGVKALTKLPSALIQSAKNIGKITQSLKNLKNISNAKNFWQSAGELGVKTLEKINPLENTFDAVKSLSQVQDMSKLAKTARTAGAFWHDVMSMNMALSEGRLEGGFSEQSEYNKLYNEYYAKNGKAPSGELQTDMMLQAKKAGFTNTLLNTGLVFYSNKIAFPSITRAKFLKGAPKFNFGKVVGEVGKEFQIIYNPADNVAKAAYTAEEISLKNSLKALKQPKQWGKLGLNYFKANLMEGIQEIGQEALAAATEKYYTDTFNNPAIASYKYGMGALMDGLGKQLNAQGAETFASGFLMGGLLEGPSKMFKFGTRNFSRIFKDKAVHEEYMKQREAQAKSIVNSLNYMHQNAQHFFDPRINNYSNQMLTAKAVDNPENLDKKTLKDIEFATFQSAVQTALRTGTFDMFLDNLSEYKNVTPEELEEAWSLEPGQGQKALQNIDTAIKSAKETAARYKYAQDNFKARVDPKKFKEGSPEYDAAIVYNKAYEESLNSLVFLQSTFDNNIERLGKLYTELNKLPTISSNLFGNFDIISDPIKLNNQIQYLMADIESVKTSTSPEAVEDLRQKRELLKALTKFQEAQDLNTGENFNQLMQASKTGVYTENTVDFYNSFIDLLEAIAGTEENKVTLTNEINKIGGPNQLFSSLLDIHQLKLEKSNVAKYINILADPEGFYESVNKNFQWMKKMYDNKKEIYKDIVNQEITNVERNEILNTLASQGIFVDLEEFAKYVEDPENYIPEYFIDTTKEMVIDTGSILYIDYAKVFIQATRTATKKPAGDPATEKQKMEDQLDELEQKKKAELNQAKEDFEQSFQNEVGISVGDARAQNADAEESNAQLKIDQAAANEKIKKYQTLLELIGSNLVDSNEIVKLAEELFTAEELALSPDEIDLDIQDAILFGEDGKRKFKKAEPGVADKALDIMYVLTEKAPTLTAQKIDEQKAILSQKPIDVIDIENTKSYIVYQERIAPINQRYEKFEQDIRDKFKDVAEDSPMEEYTADMNFDMFPEDLQALITQGYEATLVNLGLDPKSELALNPEKYEQTRQNWIESEEGRQVLKAYNEELRKENIKKAEALKNPPILKFKYAGKLVINSSITVNALNGIINILENSLRTKTHKIGENSYKLEKSDLQDLEEDIKNLKAYLGYRQSVNAPVTIQEKVFRNFKTNVEARQDEIEDVFDEDGSKLGRKFAGDPDTKLTVRATTIADQIAEAKLPGQRPGYSKKHIDSIINSFFSIYNTEIRKGNAEAFNLAWSAFTELTKNNYRQFKDQEKLNIIKESLQLNTTEDNFRKLLDQQAFSNNAVAGTRSDAVIRKFFNYDTATDDYAVLSYNDTVMIDDVEMKISDIMSKSAFDSLFGPSGVVTSFRTSLSDNRFFPLANNIKLFDKNLLENGVSGETDLVLINTKGEIMIVDIKTSTYWTGFNQPNNWKNVAYRAQLSIYRNLYYNMTGVMPKIALFPIKLKLDNAFITEASVGGEFDKAQNFTPLVPQSAKLFNTLELEYLPEVETEGGITLIKPEEPAQTKTGTEPEPIEKPSTQLITQSKLNYRILLELKEILGQQVVYNGKVGTLIRLDDGVFAVKYTNDEGVDTIIDLSYEGKSVKDQNLPFNKVGLALITEIKEVGQVSVINNQVIDAKFDDESEQTATINGVRYTVNRDKTQSIVSLTYNINDARIEELENEKFELSKQIVKLKEETKKTNDRNIKNNNIKKVVDIQETINELNKEIKKLSQNNPQRTIRGGNTNDLIFALNRLPTSFTKGYSEKKSLDEKKELKDIASVSESSSVATQMDKIVEKNYPEAYDKLVTQGVNAINKAELNSIKSWAYEMIDALYELEDRLKSEQRPTEEVSNQINGVFELLNDLELINLGKNGKILKAQPAELSKKFGPESGEQVQTGTSTSEVQEPVGGQAETIPGETGGEQTQEISFDELKKIAKSEATELDFETELPTEVNPAVAEFANITDKAELELKKNQLQRSMNKNKLTLDQIYSAFNERMLELQEKVSINSIAKGDILQDINNFTGQDLPVQVVNVKENSVILKYGDTEVEITEDDLVNNFVKPTDTPVMEEPTKPSEELNNLAKESKESFETFEEDKALQNKIIDNAEKSTEEDLINKFKNNIKIC